MNGRNWRGMQVRRWLVLAGGPLLLLALGAAFAGWASWRQDQWMREDLQYQTRMIAQTLNLVQIQRLHGNATDADKPAYCRLKEQLMAAQQANPAWKWIYLMGRLTNGTIFFQVDSEAYDAPDASPPGQTYEEASDVLQGVFDTGQAADEGPVPDRWGIWVSAFVPLKDPGTGKLVTVVGIDIDASLWGQMRARAMEMPLFCCLALIAIWLGGAFLLARRARAGACKTWFCPHIETFLAAATGLVLTLAAIWLTRQVEMRNREIAFRHLVRIETEPTADAAIGLHNLELEGFAAFFENSEAVTAKEFRRYASHLSSISEVVDWIWVEAVDATNLIPFEAEAIRRTGKLDYQIWEKDAQGLPTAVGAREHYFPIVYLAPKQNNQPVLGFDIGSDPARRAAVEAADQTHLPAASDPISFLQASEDGKGIFTLRPLFYTNDPARLKGFIAADLDINSWLRTSQAGNPDRRPMAILDLFQLRAGQPPLWLGTTAGQEESHPLLFNHLPAESTIRPLLVFGKAYAIVAHPTPTFIALHPATTAWWVAPAGLVVTAAVAWVLGLFAHRREDLARLLDEQHHELATQMHRYDLLSKQNRIITWETNTDGLYVEVSDTVEDVLGYRPEELIGKKHFYDLYPEEGREEYKASGIALAARGESIRDLACPMVSKSGDIVWVSTSGIPVRDAQGKPRGYWGTETDITARKRAEEALTKLAQENQAANDRYEALISASNTGAWEYNDATGHLWCSPEYFSMLGRDLREFDTAPETNNIEAFWLNLMHPDDRPQARFRLTAYLKNPAGMYEQTFRLQHKNGHWIWIWSRGRVLRDPSGNPTPMMVGTHIDITETKRTEEALRASEQKYRLLTESMKDVVWTLDTDTMGYLYMSPSAEKLSGYTSEEVMAQPLGATMIQEQHQEMRSQILQRTADLRAGQISSNTYFTDEVLQICKDGSILHTEAISRYWLNPRTGRIELHGVTRDITERKRAETELRESHRRFFALLANLPGMAYRCANDRDWTMEFVSEGTLDLTGYAPEDLVGNKTLTFNEIICAPYRERLWEKWQKILQEHGKFEDEYEITTRTGEIKWVWEQGEGVYDEQGRVIALEGFIADITERKRAETERERLTRAIEQSGEIIVITDAAGAILYVNPAFTRATGYSREEALGQNPRILKSGRHDAAFYREMWETLAAGKTWEGQIINKRKDGTLYTEQASISPVRDVAGRVVHFVGVKRDITPQLHDQKEKENLQAQLLQAQKMESIGRLAGGVAHDFNNMLQAILGYTEMALEQVPADQPLHADLVEIQKVAHRSAALTRQLQAFARKQAVIPRVLNLNDAVAGMSSMLRRLIGEDIPMVWKPGQDLGLVRIDPSQLDQIVANLCVNARDAIEEAGRITIETRNVEIDPASRSLHGDIAPGPYVLLAVSDNGVGMPPEVIEHLFEPFFTTKQVGKGTGLGLPTVYGIVKQNRGDIQVYSEPGLGSTFKVYLPRHAGPSEPAPVDEQIEPSSRGHETVLLVEDEGTILQATRRMLETLGYQVLATSSPEEALRLAEGQEGRIGLLLTDVIMPEINGPELVQRLQVRHPKLKHLFMSGYTANLIEKQGVQANRMEFLQKPFSRKTLAQKVREAFDRA